LNTVQRARRGLAIFSTVLLLIFIPLEWFTIRDGLSTITGLGLVASPCIASIVARIAMGDGFGDVSFRLGRGNGRALLIAWLYPVLVGLVSYGIAWMSGLAELSPLAEGTSMGLTIPGKTPAVKLFFAAAASLSIGPLVYALPAIGEEMGWRGYLLMRLIDAKVPRPVLVSGIVWGAWHAPLVLAGQYLQSPAPVLATGIFMVTILALSYLTAWLRLQTGSVWPPVVLHASWNAVILEFFAPSTTGATAVYWVGEAGGLMAGCAILATAVFVGRRWQVRRSPQDPSTGELHALAL
jgi:membrane protease YdiL (CAAX protease family)